MAAADAALAASGTVSLELAMTDPPMVIGYRVSALSASIARRMIRVPHVTLINLIEGRGVIPELLQERCTPPLLAEAVQQILVDRAARAAQSRGFPPGAPAAGPAGGA